MAITGSAQTLSNGLTVTLSTTGHVLNDRWSFSAYPTPQFSIGSGALGSVTSTISTRANFIGQVIRGASGQSANLQEWQSFDGTTATVKAQIQSGGNFVNDSNIKTPALLDTGTATAINFGATRNVGLFAASGSFGGGAGVLNIANATTAPTSNPTGGGILFVEAGALKYRGTSNAAATIVNADGTIGGYTLPTATSTTLGGIELFSDTQQSVASNAVTATASRTYGLQLNAAGQAVVNVPWTDTIYSLPIASAGSLGGIRVGTNLSIDGSGILSATDTNTTYTIASNSSGTISLVPDGYTGSDLLITGWNATNWNTAYDSRVTTGTQTFAGEKTFTSALTAGNTSLGGAYQLQVSGTQAGVRLTNSNNSGISWIDFADSVGVRGNIYYNHATETLNFGTDGPTERVSVTSTGLDVKSSTAEFPVGLSLAESSHSTSRRAAISLGSNWQIGQDSTGKAAATSPPFGSKDFFIYGNNAQRLGISIDGIVRVFGEFQVGDGFVGVTGTTINTNGIFSNKPVYSLSTGYFGGALQTSSTFEATGVITGGASITYSGKSATILEDVSGYHLNAQGYIMASRSGGIPLYSHRRNASGTVAMMQFIYNNASNGTISVASGGTPAFASGSDYRMKTEITPITDAIERMKNAKAYTFYKIDEIDPSDTLHTGFLAHELADVQADAVLGEKDAVDEDGNPVYQEVMEAKIIPVMAQAINDLIRQNELLTARIEALENN